MKTNLHYTQNVFRFFGMFFLMIGFFFSINRSNAQSPDSLYKEAASCGFNADFSVNLSSFIQAVEGGLSPLSNEFSYVTRQQFLAAGGTPVYCGQHFVIYYKDELHSPLDGFYEPTLGPDRRATFCALLEYVESVIDIPTGVVVELFVDRSFSPSNTIMYPIFRTAL